MRSDLLASVSRLSFASDSLGLPTLRPIEEIHVGEVSRCHAEICPGPSLPLVSKRDPICSLDVDFHQTTGDRIEACGKDDDVKFELLINSFQFDAFLRESLDVVLLERIDIYVFLVVYLVVALL